MSGGSADERREVKINGEVGGASSLAAESIALGPNAQFYGQVNDWLPEESEEVHFTSVLMDDAKAQFDKALSMEDTFLWLNQPFPWIPFVLVYLLSVLLLITLVLVFFPTVMEKSGNLLNQQTARSLGYGVLYFLAVPVAVVLLLMAVIGILLGILSLSLCLFSIWSALTLSAVVITYQINQRYQYHWSRRRLMVISLGIFLALQVLSFVPLIGFELTAIIVGPCMDAFILCFFPQ